MKKIKIKTKNFPQKKPQDLRPNKKSEGPSPQAHTTFLTVHGEFIKIYFQQIDIE